MKKLLIATAALAMVAGTAQAQSSVTVYGVVDVGYGETNVKNDAADKTVKSTGLADSTNASSRFGVRGTEDLGGGLSAGFTLEAGLTITGGPVLNKSNGEGSNGADDRSANSSVFGAATRQAFLTLGGAKTGTVLVGYKKQLESDFNDTFMIGTENTFGAEGQELQRIGRSNQIAYTLPSLVNGLNLTAAYSNQVKSFATAANEEDSGIDVSITSLNAIYRAGKLTVGAHIGSGDIKVGTDPLLNNGVLGGTAPTALTVGKSNAYDTTGVGIGYDFGVARVSAMYGKREVGAAGTSNLREVEYTNIGVALPMGKTTLKASLSNNKADNESGVEQEKNSGYQLEAAYSLSKRTTAWVVYGDNAKKVSGATDVDSTSARVGVTHSF
jgi:general bacterial porin, GBP family